MKTSLGALVCALWMTALHAVGHAGGVDSQGGGGTILQSSKRQVHEAVDRAMKGGIQATMYNLAFARDQVKSPYVTRILNGFYDQSEVGPGWESRQPILKDIATTSYWFNETDECPADQATRAASVPEKKLGAPICYSVPVLRQTAPEDLDTQVLALAAHEFSHHFGWRDVDAVKLQTFIFHNAKALSQISNEVMIQMAEIKPLPLPAYDSSMVYIWFQAGKILSGRPDNDASEPACSITIRFDDYEEQKEMKSTKRYPELYAPAATLQLMGRDGFASSDGMSSVRYIVNPVMQISSFDPTGSPLYGMDKSRTKARIWDVSCQGKNYHLMDLKRAFGAYLVMVRIIE